MENMIILKMLLKIMRILYFCEYFGKCSNIFYKLSSARKNKNEEKDKVKNGERNIWSVTF